MKKSLLPLLFTIFVLCGCAHRYVLKLNNGMQVTTNSKPRLKGANYYYKDAQGHEIPVPQSRVMQIEPVSMAAEDKKFTVSNPKPKRHWWQFWRSS
jgi:hypothetical protein